MILTTHAIAGASLATLMPNNPVLGFVVGFGSHFVLDAIPHWDYSLRSKVRNKEKPLNGDFVIGKSFYQDLVKIGADVFVGLAFSLLFFTQFSHYSVLLILCGAIGGMVPDALQFVYYKLRYEPLISLQKFHIWAHARSSLNDRPALGIFLQSLIIILILFVYSIIKA